MQVQITDDELDAAIYQALRKVKPSLEHVPLTPETRFANLGLQSIEMITVVFEMEDAFGISIVDNQLDTFRTVLEARATVRRLLNQS